MKVRMLIPWEHVRYFNGVNASGGWDTVPGLPGEILEDARCWELCCIRDIAHWSPTFGKLYAEPIDDEAREKVAPFAERERKDALKRGNTDLEADFRKRFEPEENEEKEVVEDIKDDISLLE